MEANDFELPEQILTHATTGKFGGYKIQTKKYKCYRVIDERSKNEYVQVETKKGDDTKTLYYSLAGNFIKEK